MAELLLKRFRGLIYFYRNQIPSPLNDIQKLQMCNHKQRPCANDYFPYKVRRLVTRDSDYHFQLAEHEIYFHYYYSLTLSKTLMRSYFVSHSRFAVLLARAATIRSTRQADRTRRGCSQSTPISLPQPPSPPERRRLCKQSD